ncbi:MAG: seg [Candidatus Taylorbacteria bacterium]|nr:seg [Candidatus Taylorbacteria bacterium]
MIFSVCVLLIGASSALAVTDSEDEAAMDAAITEANKLITQVQGDYQKIQNLAPATTVEALQQVLDLTNDINTQSAKIQNDLVIANTIINSSATTYSRSTDAKVAAETINTRALASQSTQAQLAAYVGGATPDEARSSGAVAKIQDDVSASIDRKNALAKGVKNDGQCFNYGWSIPGGISIDIFNCISQIFYYILSVATIILSIVASAFNQVFVLTVTDMKGFIDGVGIINVGWVAIRDMANILFIFMLLYLAIATILQLDEHGVKHGLSRLIVGAVLINFSLFFVKVPIDISNILAIEIYDKINPSTAVEFGMGDAVLSSLNFQSVYGVQGINSNGNPTTDAQAFAQTNAPTTTFLMALIMIATLIFIFIAVVIIFIKRLVTLMMLMIFSPLAFAGIAIPNHSISHEIDSKFWGTLLRESFYAPVFMFIMYLGLMIINSDGFKASVFNGGTSFAGGIVTVGTIINYIVVIFIFIFALTVSETMGVKGADGAIKAFDGMRGAASGWVGKNTIGRIANSTLQKGESAVWLRKAAAGQVGGNFASKFAYQQLARGVIGTTSSLSANKFGGGQSYDDKVHKREEEFKAMLDEYHDDPQKMAKLLADSAADRLGKFGTDRKAGDKLFHHLSGEQKLSVKKFLEEGKGDLKGNLALSRYFKDHGHGRLTPDEALELEKMEREKISTFDKQRFREEAFGDHGTSMAKIDEAVTRFRNLSDKQKTDLLGTLTADEQNKLSTNSKFAKEMKLSLKNFDLLERVGKGSTNTDAMKKLLSQIAYQKKARSITLEAIESTTDAIKKSKLMSVLGRQIAEMNKDLPTADQITGATREEIIENYKKSEKYNEDLTFGKNGADKNLTRFISQSDEYKAIVDEIAKITTP